MQNHLIHTAQTCSPPTRTEPSRSVGEGWCGAFLHTHYNTDLYKISRKEEQNTGGSGTDEKSVAQFSKHASRFANHGYNYKFNGKEQQSEFGVEMYDFGARNYDPALGRWMNVDPLAEMMPSWSPYNYTFNNPINYTDPDGQLPIPLITGLIGAAGGALYGVVTGKSGKEIAALAGGGFVAGATLGLGTVALGAVGGTAVLGTTGTTYVMGASGIVGGALGNITEQSIRNIGTSNSLDGNEAVISAAFGIPDAILGGLAGKAVQGAENSLTKYFSSNLSENLSESSLKSFKKEIAGELREQGLGRRQANKAANQAIERYKAGLQEGFEATNIGVKVSGKAVDVTLSTLQVGTLQEVKEEVKN